MSEILSDAAAAPCELEIAPSNQEAKQPNEDIRATAQALILREAAEARRQLAIARSNQDAKQSNEHLRAAAQASILINGGAATAVLAFLSSSIGKSEAFDLSLVKTAAVGIILYALGVFCAAFGMLFMNKSLMYWELSWRDIAASPEDKLAGSELDKIARPWHDWTSYILLASLFFFFIGTVVLGGGFWYAPWGKQAGNPTTVHPSVTHAAPLPSRAQSAPPSAQAASHHVATPPR